MPSLFYPHAHWVQTGKMAVLYQNKKWCINRKHTFPSTSTVNRFEIPRSFWENSFEKFEAAPQSPSCDLVQLTPCGCRIPPEVLAGVLSRSRSVFQFLGFFFRRVNFRFRVYVQRKECCSEPKRCPISLHVCHSWRKKNTANIYRSVQISQTGGRGGCLFCRSAPPTSGEAHQPVKCRNAFSVPTLSGTFPCSPLCPHH